MNQTSPIAFTALIEIIGVNPFVYLPEKVLEQVFLQAGKDKGKIPVKMTIDGHAFIQTLVRYSGHWRLYLNTPMRKAAMKEVGDTAVFEIWYDPEERIVVLHPKFITALEQNPEARKVYDQLPPSRRQEIAKYLSFLKTEESLDRNVKKAIDFLIGKDRFVGRDNP